MNRTALAAVGATLGVLAGAIYTLAPSAVGQGMGGSQAPLPGVDILSAPRLDVSATTPPGTTLGVSGLDGTPVETKLTPSSLNALLQPVCTQGLPELLRVGTTPRQIPVDGGHADPATAWRLVNLGKNKEVCCLPSFDGGAPAVTCVVPTDGGVANSYVVPPGYGTLEITGTSFTHSVWCIVEGTDPAVTAPVNVWEDSCVQQ